ncbi:hypothetical protein NVP1271B_06 [Vibrio phage 1.271.B._10N.286.54.B4]|nr:hypothetical protein NVP1027O_06 [Vibrio phage 1.027.O._10N.286.54.B8]AUR92333.1 hypothetical protein NVP1171O_06 [Vibrio phage 1.171.O._10N.261.52.F12]AUR94386.1 hypothetical protein NVP1194O_06 [Vibrio phage 1.194.O._10N.286.54.B1]AUR94471.1 hypothetical protein NVP1195O_06 [Vibrio phage 1.195.O._10N.286.54.C8]AUR94559.1 hypothetical protein NVP1196O_06 [Vibrio phage 1.196.O._10N.286.54.E12]AUR95026.1 hypothetical protein NVP1200O_06 [Vibrio phage 1.200.O._10N.286.55.E1]AUR99514.1 hypoth
MSGWSIGKEFKCPQCGSNRFGTSDCTSENMTGHCHGFTETGHVCKFTWPRSEEEDRKVFPSVTESE